MSSTSIDPAPLFLLPSFRRRRPSWLLRVAGVSVGGLAVGVAIGLILPG